MTPPYSGLHGYGAARSLANHTIHADRLLGDRKVPGVRPTLLDEGELPHDALLEAREEQADATRRQVLDAIRHINAGPPSIGDAAADDASLQRGRSGLVLTRADLADVCLERTLQAEPVDRSAGRLPSPRVEAVVPEVVRQAGRQSWPVAEGQRRAIAKSTHGHGPGAGTVVCLEAQFGRKRLLSQSEPLDVLLQLTKDVVASVRRRIVDHRIVEQHELQRRERIPILEIATRARDALLGSARDNPALIEVLEVRREKERLTSPVGVAEVLDALPLAIAQNAAALDGDDGGDTALVNAVDLAPGRAKEVVLGVVSKEQQRVEMSVHIGLLQRFDRIGDGVLETRSRTLHARRESWS